MSDDYGDDGFDIIEPPEDKPDINDFLVLGDDAEYWEAVWDYMPDGLSDGQIDAMIEMIMEDMEEMGDDWDWMEFFEDFAEFWDWWEEHYG